MQDNMCFVLILNLPVDSEDAGLKELILFIRESGGLGRRERRTRTINGINTVS